VKSGGDQEGGEFALHGLGVNQGHPGAGPRRMSPDDGGVIELVAFHHAMGFIKGPDGQARLICRSGGHHQGLAGDGQPQHQKPRQGLRSRSPTAAGSGPAQGPLGPELECDGGEGVEEAIFHHPPRAIVAEKA